MFRKFATAFGSPTLAVAQFCAFLPPSPPATMAHVKAVYVRITALWLFVRPLSNYHSTHLVYIQTYLHMCVYLDFRAALLALHDPTSRTLACTLDADGLACHSRWNIGLCVLATKTSPVRACGMMEALPGATPSQDSKDTHVLCSLSAIEAVLYWTTTATQN